MHEINLDWRKRTKGLIKQHKGGINKKAKCTSGCVEQSSLGRRFCRSLEEWQYLAWVRPWSGQENPREHLPKLRPLHLSHKPSSGDEQVHKFIWLFIYKQKSTYHLTISSETSSCCRQYVKACPIRGSVSSSLVFYNLMTATEVRHEYLRLEVKCHKILSWSLIVNKQVLKVIWEQRVAPRWIKRAANYWDHTALACWHWDLGRC